ncbi:MAG: hypothetical protein KF703_08380 [Actinobacteria bacterium]|nr:hypothetical protein [Actinomycetota bacterium]
MSGRTDQFTPKHLDPERWNRIGPIARAFVESAGPSTPATAVAWMNAVAQLLVFCETEGLPLTADVVFSPRVVEHFIAVGCAHLSSGTRANYRSQLRTIGEGALGPEACPNRTVAIRASDPSAPYSRAEEASLISWANGQPTAFKRHNAKVLLSLGLGAGLSSMDIAALVGTDVEVTSHGVTIEVSGPNARTVPVLRRWEEQVADTAQLCGDRPMFRSARERVNRKDISRFIEGCRESDAPRLSVQRLRITWIVGHLTAGTPVRALLPAAGVEAKQLARYYPFVPAPTVDQARSVLRDPGPP